jgi:hypothetical protein
MPVFVPFQIQRFGAGTLLKKSWGALRKPLIHSHPKTRYKASVKKKDQRCGDGQA